MIVVADTSPVNYLVLIGQAEILRTIYGRITIPKAVMDELSSASSPPPVKAWLEKQPDWLEISTFVANEDESLANLDRGEREAIALAERFGAIRLIVDDGAARREAEKRGIPVIGLLGVLVEAARRDLLSLSDALDQLAKTSFYVSDDLLKKLRELQYRSKATEPRVD